MPSLAELKQQQEDIAKAIKEQEKKERGDAIEKIAKIMRDHQITYAMISQYLVAGRWNQKRLEDAIREHVKLYKAFMMKRKKYVGTGDIVAMLER